MKKLRQQGFGLVQVIFTSTIVGTLTLVGIRMMKEQETKAKLLSLNFESRYLNLDIKQILSDVDSCGETFRGLSPIDSHVNAIYQSFKKQGKEGRFPVHQVSDVFNPQGMKIKSIQVSLEGANPRPKGLTNLIINLEQQSSPEVLKKTFKYQLYYELDQNSQINLCYFYSNLKSDYWNRFSPETIAYSNGTVGFRTPPERELFAVNGKLRARSEVCYDNGVFFYSPKNDDIAICANNQMNFLSQTLTFMQQKQVYELRGNRRSVEADDKVLCLLKESKITDQSECLSTDPFGRKNSINTERGKWKLELVSENPGDSFCQYECMF